MRKTTLLVGLLFAVEFALAQGFQVISTSPVEAAVNVPLNTTISFTFSESVDTSYHFEMDDDEILPIGLLGPEPFDSAEVISWEMSPDLTTIYFEVAHTENTDFLWLIIGAFSEGGDPLSEPFCLHYSTAGDLGPWTVSGTVSIDDGDPTHALVGLMDCSLFDQEEDGGSLLAGTFVPDASGDYVIPYVRDGVYWPVAAYDLDGDGEIDPDEGDLLGFWDPDGNMDPDSLIITGDHVDGIDIALFSFEEQMVTAHEYLEEAFLLAGDWADDQELRMIGSATDMIELDGTSPAWGYMFYSPSGEFFTNIVISYFFTQIDTSYEGPFPEGMIPIPEYFIDSDEAMLIAWMEAGSDFEDEYDIEARWLHGGNLMWMFPDDPERVAWIASWSGYDNYGTEFEMHVVIDIETGEIIDVIWEEDVDTPGREQLPSLCELQPNYPNPFNPATMIPYQLSQAGWVRLEVFDLLGRQVALLVDAWQPAGFYEVRFDAQDSEQELPAGIYFYRLTAGENTSVRKMTLMK